MSNKKNEQQTHTLHLSEEELVILRVILWNMKHPTDWDFTKKGGCIYATVEMPKWEKIPKVVREILDKLY